MWCSCSILNPAATLGAPVLLRAQTSPARPRSSGAPSLQSVEPPIWLRECFTPERMRSRSVSTREPVHKRTPPRTADPAQSPGAEKVRKQRAGCTLAPRQAYSRHLRLDSTGMPGIHLPPETQRNLGPHSGPSASAWNPPLCCWNTPRDPRAQVSSTSLFSILQMPTHSLQRPSSILATKLSPARGSPELVKF